MNTARCDKADAVVAEGRILFLCSLVYGMSDDTALK